MDGNEAGQPPGPDRREGELTGVVIVGGGQAGFQVAASLRDQSYDGRIVLLGEEPGFPYQRPPLSKAYLDGMSDAEMLQFRPGAFFAEHDIDFRPGERAVRIERDVRQVVLGSGDRLRYDHLVLATGARNRALPVPGAELDGVVQLRTLADAADLKRRLETVRRAVVVGAGFIGLEFAAVAAGRGIHVTVVEATDRPMSRALSPAMSAFFRSAHEARGVRFVFGATVVGVQGENGRAVGIETGEGVSIPADLVLVGIGVVPNMDLAIEAQLPVANGILVDENLMTADPHVSAAGDCVAHASRFARGNIVRIESVQNAVDQAKAVAARLAGKPAPYGAVPWFWSDQGPLKLQIAGLSCPHERAVLRGDPASGAFSVFCFAGDRLLGVESVNRPADHMIARRLLASGASPEPEQVCDPGFDLKALAARPASAQAGAR